MVASRSLPNFGTAWRWGPASGHVTGPGARVGSCPLRGCGSCTRLQDRCGEPRRLEPRKIGASVMGRAGQRACRGEQEAFRQGYFLQRFEFVWRHEALDLGVLACWLQVLADYDIGFVLTERLGLLDVAMADTTGWERVYQDEVAVIYFQTRSMP